MICIYIYIFICSSHRLSPAGSKVNSTILYYIILYYIMLYYIILYYIIFKHPDATKTTTTATTPGSL